MYYIFDNGGKTADRYTLITTHGNVYTFDEKPFSPSGIGQFAFTYTEKTKLVQTVLKDESLIGKRIKLKDLSEEAQKFVKEKLYPLGTGPVQGFIYH